MVNLQLTREKIYWCRIVDGNANFLVYSDHGTPIRAWDDGEGRLWVYRDADGLRAVVRSKTWESAYQAVVDECMPDADDDWHAWVESDDDPLPEGVAARSGTPVDETVGTSCYAAVCLNGERLEPLTWKELCRLEWRLIPGDLDLK